MSDKPKVYQGVRVKTTVKELLQKRRALQAAIKTATKSQGLASHNVCSTPLSAHHLDLFPGRSAPDCNLQPRLFTDTVCNLPMENSFDNQQLMNMMPAEHFNNSSNLCPPGSAQHWSHGYFPSNVDYYSNSLASSSPGFKDLSSESLNLPSPVDYNSYSPPQSRSSSSSCYNSPTRMDLSGGFIPENYHYQHCSLQHCFCLSHWSGPQDGMPASDYSPYGTSDCLYSSVVEDNYFRREPSNPEMCYL